MAEATARSRVAASKGHVTAVWCEVCRPPVQESSAGIAAVQQNDSAAPPGFAANPEADSEHFTVCGLVVQ